MDAQSADFFALAPARWTRSDGKNSPRASEFIQQDLGSLQCSLCLAGFYFKPSASRARLEKLDERAPKGLLSYEKFSTRQLRSFCFRRGIVVNDLSPKARSKLIKRLERSDKNPRFDFRYMAKLPREIRDMIYFQYISTRDNLTCPLQ